MTIAADVGAFLSPTEPDPLLKRGRYQIVPPDGGDAKPHTRVTNFAKKLEDEYGLTKWKMRTVAIGVAQRSDIVAAVLADSDKPKVLDELCEKAQDAAQANVRRETGTALHRMIERVDAGEDLTFPEPYASDVASYTAALASIEAKVELIETVIVHEPLKLAGRLDRTVLMPDENLAAAAAGDKPVSRYICDLKTGEDLSYSWGSIAIQLAIYAGATTTYDPDTKKHSPMPPVDQSRALVVHLPAGQGRAVLYWVNLEDGRAGIALTQQLLAWRKGTKKLATTDRTAQLAARATLRTYTEQKVRHLIDAGYGAELAADWPSKVPTLKSSADHSEKQLDAILAAVDAIEGHHRMPFGETHDPRSAK